MIQLSTAASETCLVRNGGGLHPTSRPDVTPDEHNSCFDAWLSEHAAMLYRVTNGFAAGADRHDLMQELLLALWHAIPAFRGGSRVSTFIYRVAHNAALTWKRRLS